MPASGAAPISLDALRARLAEPAPRPRPAPHPRHDALARRPLPTDARRGAHRAPATASPVIGRGIRLGVTAAAALAIVGAGQLFAPDDQWAATSFTKASPAGVMQGRGGALVSATSADMLPTALRIPANAAAAPVRPAPPKTKPRTSPKPKNRAVVNRVAPKAAFAWSVPTHGDFTSCFCKRWGAFHDGIDIAAPLGTPILAVGDGVVIRTGRQSGYGQTIYIRHANGDISFYGHMRYVLVKVGQRVRAGQKISGVGNEGFSTGPHLHFSVIRGGGVDGRRIDPVPWLRARHISIR